jgi:hypothetical protein
MTDKQFSIPNPFGEDGRIMIDCYGSGEYFIEVNGEKILFEWSDRFGPLPLNKDGSEKSSIGPSHKFWLVASLWNLQGRRMKGNVAVWHKPRPPIYRTEKRGRKTFIVEVIDPGEKGYDW